MRHLYSPAWRFLRYLSLYGKMATGYSDESANNQLYASIADKNCRMQNNTAKGSLSSSSPNFDVWYKESFKHETE